VIHIFGSESGDFDPQPRSSDGLCRTAAGGNDGLCQHLNALPDVVHHEAVGPEFDEAHLFQRGHNRVEMLNEQCPKGIVRDVPVATMSSR
jgi:hypothetical protein